MRFYRPYLFMDIIFLWENEIKIALRSFYFLEYVKLTIQILNPLLSVNQQIFVEYRDADFYLLAVVLFLAEEWGHQKGENEFRV